MVYRIIVKGQLAPEWQEWFAGMVVAPIDDGATRLEGEVADQSALHGLLRKIRDLGLPLMHVAQIEDGPPREEEALR